MEKSIQYFDRMDYYFNFVTGKINRGPLGCPVATESSFGSRFNSTRNDRKQSQLEYCHLAYYVS